VVGLEGLVELADAVAHVGRHDGAEHVGIEGSDAPDGLDAIDPAGHLQVEEPGSQPTAGHLLLLDQGERVLSRAGQQEAVALELVRPSATPDRRDPAESGRRACRHARYAMSTPPSSSTMRTERESVIPRFLAGPRGRARRRRTSAIETRT